MGDKGKRDKGRREEQKKAKHTLKEKRKQKRQPEVDSGNWKINENKGAPRRGPG